MEVDEQPVKTDSSLRVSAQRAAQLAFLIFTNRSYVARICVAGHCQREAPWVRTALRITATTSRPSCPGRLPGIVWAVLRLHLHCAPVFLWRYPPGDIIDMARVVNPLAVVALLGALAKILQVREGNA